MSIQINTMKTPAIKRITLFCIFLFLTAILVFAHSKKESDEQQSENDIIPVWITDAGRNKVFPKELYLSSLGIGDSNENAKERAGNGIALYIETEIKSETKVRNQEIKDGDKIESTNSIDESINLLTNQKAYAMEFTVPWYDSDHSEYYCVAYIEKAKCWEVLQHKIEKIQDCLDAQLAMAHSDKTEFWRSIYLNRIQNIRNEFDNLYDLAVLINPVEGRNYKSIQDRILAAQNEINNYKQFQTVQLVIENDCNGMVYRATSAVLEQNGFTVGTDCGKYIGRIVVDLNMHTETFDQDVVYVSYPGATIIFTDLHGMQVASFTVKAKKAISFEENNAKERSYRSLEKEIGNFLICNKECCGNECR